MIEAMACGTPVIAYRRGSIPEIIKDNISGFVVDSIEEAVMASRRAASLDRAKVRAEFERRFTVERMARDYVEIYPTLLSSRSRPVRVGVPNGRGWQAVQSSVLAPDFDIDHESCRDTSSEKSEFHELKE
jgi:hypothetical protein